MTRWTASFILQQVVMLGLLSIGFRMVWITVREMLEEWER